MSGGQSDALHAEEQGRERDRIAEADPDFNEMVDFHLSGIVQSVWKYDGARDDFLEAVRKRRQDCDWVGEPDKGKLREKNQALVKRLEALIEELNKGL